MYNYVFIVELAEVYLPDYSGGLLDLAVDLGDRLLKAFANPNTNIPYGTVNLRNGVPLAETPIVCTACAGNNFERFLEH